MSWFREPDAEPIPGYRLIEPIGTGGFGEVWKCEAPGGIFKAIKFVFGNLNSLEGDAARAEQELRALRRIKDVRHPFVLQMDRIEVVHGELLIVMELADRNLHECMLEAQAQGLPGIPRELLLRYLHDAAEGLDYMIERHNLQHLDVKPRNLFVVADRVKVADFGLVKHLERSSSTGLGSGGFSPFYAAPETFVDRVSRHSDQYSLAIVYQEMLTGQRPFTGKNVRQLALQHMNTQPDLSPLPEEDRPIIARALSKDPDQRFPNCLALVRTLAGLPVGGVSQWSIVSLGDFALPPAAPAPGQRPPPPAPGPKGLDDTPFPVPAPAGDPGEVSVPRPEEVVRLFDRAPPAPEEGAPAGEAEAGEAESPEELAKTSPVSPLQAPSPAVSRSMVGVLRPNLLIGLGSFGRRALLELRCRLLDRVGDLEQVPMFRFLYLDSDPDATTKAVAVSQDVALTEAQVLPVPLRPASAYRRRQLDALSEWLPQQKLYAIPRSLQPMQSRALGRLAVADHYLRLLSRLRREVQVATHPESLANSLSQTGLPLRSNTPRVFIFADACSGSGGGLMDLGVTVRQALAQQRFAKAQVTVFLFCGSPEDPATPAAELANLYASLTELYHYADPAVTFSARYGADDGPAVSNEPFPFDSVYLLPLQHRSPEALRDAIAHLSTFVCNDLTTSLGVELDQARGAARGPEQTPFRGFGTYSVWFPRGLLLREAARQMAERLIEDWQAPGVESSDAPIDSICEGVLGDPGLQPESLREQLQAEAEAAGDSAPAQLVQALLEQLEEEAGPAGLGDAAEWAQRALDRVHETVGMRPGSELESAYQRGRTTRVWNEASRRLAETWGKHLADQVLRLLDFPGSRLAAGEAGLRRLIRFCNEKVEALARKVQERALRGQRERAEVQAALDACPQPGAFRLFSGSATRALNHFLDRVRAFCRHRVQEDLDHAVVQFYRHLAAFFEERLGDLSFCRYRLTPLRQALGRSMPARAGALGSLGLMGADPANPIPVSVVDPLREALRGAATLRVVLPRGELDLETAALAFLQRLGPDHWRHLEEVVQSLVLEPMGGLYALCLKSSDLAAHLSGALIEQTAAFLGELLPVADVAQVAFSASLAQHSDLRDQLREFHQSAAPLMSARQVPAGSYLLVPQGQAGDALGEHARAAIPGLHILTVSELSTDLVLCREDGFFPPEALKPLLRSCRGAYAEMAANPTTSPHSRFDVTEWILPE